ncbi:MAG TPA: PadR family transcriptional regulator, partial [Candidatus Eremiobacteraceae bacterium]|nr:PadR family transcriptional regulator [Candidatus Eremiobacteraceae bacterium]
FLTDPALLIMVSLAEKPKHGYSIMKDVERFGELPMSPGTLYGAIARLDGRGWIEEVQTRDYRRRPFRLTPLGDRSLREHLSFLGALGALGRRRLRAASSKRKGRKQA